MKNHTIALTSISASCATSKTLERIKGGGSTPIVISERRNFSRMRRWLSKEDLTAAIILNKLSSSNEAIDELCAALNGRGIKLAEWINITDDTSAFYIRACKRLGITGHFFDPYVACRVKTEARRLAQIANLCPVNFSVHDINDFSLPREFLFPFVAKPILGTGSEGVSVIRIPSEWRHYLRAAQKSLAIQDLTICNVNPSRQILVEELIAGQECQVDGFVENGNIQYCALGLKTCDSSEHGFRETHGILYRPFSLEGLRKHDSVVTKWTDKLIEAVGMINGTFHIELKVTGKVIKLLEINPRPGGGANVPAIERLSGVNLNYECVRLWSKTGCQSQGTPECKSIAFAVRYPKSVGSVAYVRDEGEVRYRDGNKSGLLDWTPLCSPGSRVDPRKGEQYLGVLMGVDLCSSFDDMKSVTSALIKTVNSKKFIRENPK